MVKNLPANEGEAVDGGWIPGDLSKPGIKPMSPALQAILYLPAPSGKPPKSSSHDYQISRVTFNQPNLLDYIQTSFKILAYCILNK